MYKIMDVAERTNKYVKNVKGTRKINTRPVYIFEKKEKFKEEIIIIMVPITEDDYLTMKTYFDNDDEMMVRLREDLMVNKRALKIWGSTDDVEPEIANQIGVQMMWEYSFNDRENLLINTNNGEPQITQYFDCSSMVDIAINMLGKPPYVAVFEMRLDRYLQTPFYINYVKQHYEL